jgi:histidinol-phosphate phosphatase family protein
MLAELKQNGAYIDAIYYCPHHPDDKCECRKPGTALFQKAAHDLDIDLAQSFVIGDRDIDIKAGEAIGSKTLLAPPVRKQVPPLLQLRIMRPKTC